MVFHRKAGQHRGGAGVTFRQHLEHAGLVLAGWLVASVSLRWVVRGSRVLGSLAYRLDPKGRRVCRQNLDAVFGEGMAPAEKDRIAKAGYRSFARTMLELFWSPNLTAGNMARMFRSEGLGHGRPGGAIYVTTHSSNFEWLGQNVARFLGPGIVVAQRLKNPLLGAGFDRLRGSTGHAIIPQERAIARMLKHLREGGYFCAVVDLNLDPNEASVIIDEFSGLKTCVTQLHAALALHTGAAIIPSECIPLADGTYRMVYHPPLEIAPDASAAAIAQQCWNVLEPGLLARPEHWLWSYKHWRFRPSGDGAGRYPAYANSARRFDRALLASPSPG